MVVLMSIHLVFTEVECLCRSFFDLIQHEYNLPVEIGLLKVCPVLNCFPVITQRHNLKAGVIYSPTALVSLSPAALVLKLLLRGLATRGSTSPRPSLVSRASRALGEPQ